MPLAMSRPWKHPNSGVYWLRKGVPEDLRELVGKREEKRSLGTRDPVEAKRRHAEALAEIERRWANLRAGNMITTGSITGVTFAKPGAAVTADFGSLGTIRLEFPL